MIQRFLSGVLCAAFLATLLVGCASTRTMSFPKMNWAWWKKKDAPNGRHDEAIAAPSSTMSPVNSLVKSDGKEPLAPATERTRKPYDTEIAPPESKSFGPATSPADASLARSTRSPSDPAAPPTADLPNSVAKANSPLGANAPLGANSPPSAESTLAKSMENSPRKSFELSPPTSTDQRLDITGSNSYVPSQAPAVADRGSSASGLRGIASGVQMQSNPYASGETTVTAAAVAAPGTSPLMPVPKSNAAAGGSTYDRTPYNGFAPKTPGMQTNPLAANTPLTPLQPKKTTSPENSNAAIGSSMPPTATGQQTIAQVSYTPGSIGSSRSLSELLAGTTPAATQVSPSLVNNPVAPAVPAAEATSPVAETASPNTGTRIGGGGAFRIIK